MIRYNNILPLVNDTYEPLCDPSATPKTPPAQNLGGVATPQPPQDWRLLDA